MSISLEAVGVLATIMPIGLLIVGFEIRTIPSVVATERAGTFLLWYTGVALFLAVILGFLAEYRMVVALMEGRPLDGLDTWIVQVGFFFIGMMSFLLVAGSLGQSLGLLERLGRRARTRTAKSPRRFARKVAYVRKHHPSNTDDGAL